MQKWVVGLAVAVLGFVILTGVTVRRDVTLVCEITGSVCRYTEWFGSLKTDHWKKPSVLESFMCENYPKEFTNRWQRWTAVRKNFLGSPMVACAGNREFPPPNTRTLDEYVEGLPNAEKKAIHDFFRDADAEAAAVKMSNIFHVLVRAHEEIRKAHVPDIVK